MTTDVTHINADDIAVLKALGRLVGLDVMSFSEAAAIGSRAMARQAAVKSAAPEVADEIIDRGMTILADAAVSPPAFELTPTSDRTEASDRAAFMHAVSGRHAAVWTSDDRIIVDTDIKVGDLQIPIFLSLKGDTIEVSDGGLVIAYFRRKNLGRCSELDLVEGLRSALDHNDFHLDDAAQISAEYDVSRRNYEVFAAQVRAIVLDFVNGAAKSIQQFQSYLDGRLKTTISLSPG